MANNLIAELNKNINKGSDFFETLNPPYHMLNNKTKVLWVCKYDKNNKNILKHAFIKENYEIIEHDVSIEDAKRILYNLRNEGYVPVKKPDISFSEDDDNLKLPYK